MSVHKTFENLTTIDAVPLSVSVAPRRSWLGRIKAWLTHARARRELLRCQELDPRLARDIGLTACDLLRESRAPFWESVRRR